MEARNNDKANHVDAPVSLIDDLRESFPLLCDACPEGIFIHEGSTVRYCNDRLASILRTTSTEVIGWTVAQLAEALGTPASHADIEQILRLPVTDRGEGN